MKFDVIGQLQGNFCKFIASLLAWNLRIAAELPVVLVAAK